MSNIMDHQATLGEYVCPCCGSNDVTGGGTAFHGSDLTIEYECEDCTAAWYDVCRPVERVVTREVVPDGA